MTKKITEISEICNYYGILEIKEENDHFYWNLDNYDGGCWYPIPKSLYDEILKHNESLKAFPIDKVE